MDRKRDLRNSILLPTLTYGSENWTWSVAQHVGEMSYLRGVCRVSRWDGLSNEKCGMRGHGSGVSHDVVKWVERNTLR